jgi:hypothetical protein
MREEKIKIEIVPLSEARKVLAQELKLKRVANGTTPYKRKLKKSGQI